MNMVGTINPEKDYKEMEEGVTLVQKTVDYMTGKGLPIAIPTNYRYWEYGSGVELSIRYSITRRDMRQQVLNVGSGWDGLSPTIAYNCRKCVITDCEPEQAARNDRERINALLREEGREEIKLLDNGLENLPQQQFDIVYCISVLEHTQNEKQCWLNLTKCVKPKGILFITTDCVPNHNKKYVWDELRTTNYTPEMLKERVEMIVDEGFSTIGTPDYIYHGDYVNDYTFFRAGFIKGY